MNDLINSFNNQEIVRKGKRGYLLLSLTDHVTATRPAVLRQAVNAVCDSVNWGGKRQINKIVSEEERGGFISVAVALQRDLPFTLAKQNPIQVKGQIGFKFGMDYNSKMTMYLNGLKKGDRVVILDDIIATGGTMIAMIKAVKKAGIVIKDIVALAEKVEMNGVQRIKRETGYEVKTIIKLDTSGNKSKVIETIFD